MFPRLLFVAITALLAIQWISCDGSSTEINCLKDADCPGDLVCLDTGLCGYQGEDEDVVTEDDPENVEEPAEQDTPVEREERPPLNCIDNDDCPPGWACVEGFCEPGAGDEDQVEQPVDQVEPDAPTEDPIEQPDVIDTDPPADQVDNETGCPDDLDCDNIPDDDDLCQRVPSDNNNDRDDDGVGDICDNCPDTPNHSQVNSDTDQHGDSCDTCPQINNPENTNSDEDSHGDACDNCPATNNEDQSNLDGDSLGDVCDPTPDEPDVCEIPECFDFPENLNPCPALGLDCNWEFENGFSPGQCTLPCETTADCPGVYECFEGECGCGEAPPLCEAVRCESNNDCAVLEGLNGCLEVESDNIVGKVCTNFCNSHDDCPGFYECHATELVCICGDYPFPNVCEANECGSRNDCYSLGWPEEARCIIPQGTCSLPCFDDDAYCKQAFNDLYFCQQIQNEFFCMCNP
jgi:hypothetical protein